MRTRWYDVVVVGASGGPAPCGAALWLPGSLKIAFGEAGVMVKDPVCGMNVDESKAAATAVYRGQTYHFCSQGCKATFEKTPEKYAAR